MSFGSLLWIHGKRKLRLLLLLNVDGLSLRV